MSLQFSAFVIFGLFLFNCADGAPQEKKVELAGERDEHVNPLLRVLQILDQQTKNSNGNHITSEDARYETLPGIKPSYENEASSSITGEDKTPSNRDQPIVSTKEKRNPEVEFLKLFRNMNRKQRLRNVADGIVRALILGKPWAAAY